MSSVLRPVRKRKKVRAGPGRHHPPEDYADLEVDAKVELIRSLVPLGLMHVEEVLVTALAGERRRDASMGGRRHCVPCHSRPARPRAGGAGGRGEAALNL